MALATFRFFEELNDFLPRHRRKVAFGHEFDRRASVKDMIEALGVPHPEVELIRANGESVGFDYIVGDGDRILVYPVFESFDVSEHVRVRPEPLRVPRFVLDTPLGTLARYLRLCGFDARYRNDYGDAEVARISVDEGRTLLTRDRGVLKRRIVTRGYYVRSDRPREQLSEILSRFQLREAAAPLTRCPRCNGILRDVEKSAVDHRLEPLTRRYYDAFRMCADCGALYWRGSHVLDIERLIARA